MTTSIEPGLGEVAQLVDHANTKLNIALLNWDSPGEDTREKLSTVVRQAMESTDKAGVLLRRLGVVVEPKSSRPVTLSTLSSMGDADTRELLELLTSALVIAERIDKKRGNFVDASILGEGEPAGTDYADTVGQMVFRLRAEVEPMKGRD